MNRELINNIMNTQEYFFGKMAAHLLKKDNAFAWASGINNKHLNGATHSSEMRQLDEATLEAITDFFGNLKLPWLFMVNSVLKPSNITELLVARGFQLTGAYPVMWYDLRKSLPTNILAEYDIKEANNNEGLSHWRLPLQEGFGSGEEESTLFYQATAKVPYGNGQSFHHYVAYAGKQPVACATLSVSQFGARIDNVATCSNYLRQGFGRAVTLFAMVEAQKLGAQIACLESSDEGLPLYSKMGFEEIYQNQTYELK
jgi:hypothetical protein